MNCLRFLACLAALPLGAATVNVTGDYTVLLKPGDALVFTMSAANFGSRIPDKAAFTLAVAALPDDAAFSASLESRYGDVELDFAPVSIHEAYFAGSRYSGSAFSISGSSGITADDADALFSGLALFTLRNTGASDVTFGMPAYRLGQTLSLTLSGKGRSIGAVITRVSLNSVETSRSLSLGDAGAAVPEPFSAALVSVGAALLCALRVFLKRRRERRIQSAMQA